MPTKKTPAKRPVKRTTARKNDKSLGRKRGMGLVPDRHDERDFKFAHVAGTLQAMSGLRVLPKKVDLRRMMSPIRNQGPVGACHDDQTEVLTDAGWALFSVLDGSERLATVDPDTSMVSFEVPTKLVRYHYTGDMVVGRNERSLDFKVTPDHVMLVRRWDEAERTLSPASDLGWYSGLMNRVVWEGDSQADTYLLAGVDNRTRSAQRSSREVPMASWLKFLGIYLAEGTMLSRTQRRGVTSYKIQIAAVKPREREFVRNVLSEIGVSSLELKDRFTFQNKQVYETLARLGLEGIKAADKFVPRFVFRQSAAMIEAFLEGHFAGDGSLSGDCRSHYTCSTRLADDLQTLIFLSGDESFVSVREARESRMANGQTIVGNYPEYRVSAAERKGLSIERAKSITSERYDGEVFCAEVPTHHTLITRRNGKILVSGNCTAFATAVGLMESTQIELQGELSLPLSPLFLYYATRERARQVNQDAGASLRDVIKTAAEVGVCAESEWPYDASKWAVKPPPEAYDDNDKLVVGNYYRVANITEMKQALALTNPVVFGLMLYDSFETVSADGKVPVPDTNRENFLGGHALLAVGYNDRDKYIIVRNSWGTEWGDKGYCYIPYDYMSDRRLCVDMWTATFAMGSK